MKFKLLKGVSVRRRVKQCSHLLKKSYSFLFCLGSRDFILLSIECFLKLLSVSLALSWPTTMSLFDAHFFHDGSLDDSVGFVLCRHKKIPTSFSPPSQCLTQVMSGPCGSSGKSDASEYKDHEELIVYSLSFSLISWTDNSLGRQTRPEFTEPIANVTVFLGREAALTCSVKDLGSYRVCILLHFYDLLSESRRLLSFLSVRWTGRNEGEHKGSKLCFRTKKQGRKRKKSSTEFCKKKKRRGRE